MTDQLKLIALDADDLQIISAQCQDALIRPGDIGFHARDGCLAVEMNRFAWDHVPRSRRDGNERRRALLTFSRVLNVRSKGIDSRAPAQILSLLAIEFTPQDTPGGEMMVHFSGDAKLALTVECIDVLLSDLGAAWHTASRPAHDNPGP